MTSISHKTTDGYLRRWRCPLCGDEQAPAILVASDPPAERLAPDELGEFLSGYASRRVFFTYGRCRTCGLVYCPVYFSEPQLGALYGQQPENMGDAPLWARQRTQAGYCQLLRKHGAMTGTYLELGCDIGLLAELCAGAGRFERFWLYEPNRETHGEVRARLAGHDVSLRTAAFSAVDLPAATVSTAVMVHVLDHLLEPVAVMMAVARALQPGGVALIVTHDVRSALARVLGRRWPPFTLQHPQLFSAATLTRVVKAAGLEPVEVVRTVNHFPLMHLVRAFVAVLGGPGGVLARHDGPAVPLRLGNIAMVARKA